MSGFSRGFKKFDLGRFKNDDIYGLLNKDIQKGIIFPALRNDRIDFYYQGGRIFQYEKNKFTYNTDYIKYMNDNYKVISSNNYIMGNERINLNIFYEDLKEGVEKRFKNKNNEETERQFLGNLYQYTYFNKKMDTVVLDIEIYINGKKCDLILYNNKLQKLMLVEGKVTGNKELVSETTPKVVEQVKGYSNWLNGNKEACIEQYSEYIKFINSVFDTDYNSDIKNVCESAKLLVFEANKTISDEHKRKLEDSLGKDNVLFIGNDKDNVDIDKIWEMLDK